MMFQQVFNKQQTVVKVMKKQLKIHFLPFAVVQIVGEHEDEVNRQLQSKIQQLERELLLAKIENEDLQSQKQTLKNQLEQQQFQVQKQKANKQMALQNIQKMSRVSQASKQYCFQFIVDPKAKNASSFITKNQVVKKVKNDLKWDQISSEAPLPKGGRHYFSFGIKNFVPDFMFGIVTLKGKDTVNAFMGVQTICLYASKKNSYIYERGRHYKVNPVIKRSDTVYVIVDRQKGLIQWTKKKNLAEQKTSEQIPNKQWNDIRIIIADINLAPDNQFYDKQQANKTVKVRRDLNSSQLVSLSKASQKIIMDSAEDVQYIHSTSINEQMLSHEIYAYAQIYNVNQPLKLNQRK